MILLLAVLLLIFLPGTAGAADSIKIIINKKINKLAYIKNGETIRIFPVATGRSPDLTPEGSWKVVRKVVNPFYTKKKIPGGDPRNPLGVRWLGLNACGTSGGTYGIHGTNNPKSIGTYASGGCVRMYNRDVIWLYSNTPVGTPVDIINRDWDLEQKPVKVVVDGRNLNFDDKSKPYRVKDRVMVPCRLVAETMGCQVSWNQADSQVTLTRGGITLTAAINSTTIYVDGVAQQIDVATTLRNDKVFIQLRPLAEVLGYQVGWNEATQTVLLTVSE